MATFMFNFVFFLPGRLMTETSLFQDLEAAELASAASFLATFKASAFKEAVALSAMAC